MAGGVNSLGNLQGKVDSNNALVVSLAEGSTITTPSMTVTVASVAAAGSTQGDATAITETGPALIEVTGADATKGAALPAAAAGQVLFVKNAAAAVLKLYPASGDAINGLAANASLDMAANTSAVLCAKDGTTWYTIPLLPS